ncbi:DUF5658 family protein [Aquibacillus saliphilus]|uniref:DUF5658 family protein n=1 Tax=Aquibacillus saliphilus TaxID=1909422 RepID=UPI001CF0A1F9|nr:DUF5658 family protein [Aquibacillus saliphilus]
MFKHLFLYLAVLNVVDGFITLYGLKNAYITELNPVMNELYQLNPFLFITSKVGLSLLLIMFIVAKQIPETHLVSGLAIAASIIYTKTFVLHVFWLVQI